MFNNLFGYVALFFIGTTALFFGVSEYREYKLEVSEQEVKQLKTQTVRREVEHKKEVFENNQSITFKIEKEIKDEEIPSSIGVHTIPIN